MNEHSFIRAINRHVTCNHYWKINADFAPGVPDCFYEGTRQDLWVEYKYISKPPARGTTLIKLSEILSPKQHLWLDRRYQTRNDCWVIIGHPQGGVVFTDKTWSIDIPYKDFLQKNLKKREIGLLISTTINL